MTATFDLIDVFSAEGLTMSCTISDGDGETLIVPFPAAESGPKIVAALLERPSFGFADKKAAETAYMVAHFRNMRRGENDAGQSYPFRVQAGEAK